MKNSILLFALLLCSTLATSQEEVANIPTPNYRLAAKFSPDNLKKMIHSTTIRPKWLKRGNRFWYQYKTSEGSRIKSKSCGILGLCKNCSKSK